jgi:hypothetical protein
MILHMEHGNTRCLPLLHWNHVVCIRSDPGLELEVREIRERTFINWGEVEHFYKKNYKGIERLQRAVEYAWTFKMSDQPIAFQPLPSLFRLEYS